MRVEITIHRIGGTEGPRHFSVTDNVEATAGTIQFLNVQSSEHSAWFMRITLRELIPAEEDFVSCIAQLDTADGQHIGARPVLIYDRPCDVPVWSTFQQPRVPDLGIFSVGLRRVS